MFLKSYSFLAAVAFLSCLVGCKQDTAKTATYPVTGTITQAGKPVAEADIIFVPSGAGGLAAFGKSDSQGKFEMRTFEPGDGVATGAYKVKITKLEKGNETDSTVYSDSEAEQETYNPEDGDLIVAPKNLLPKKYADHNSSGITHTVADLPTTLDVVIN